MALLTTLREDLEAVISAESPLVDVIHGYDMSLEFKPHELFNLNDNLTICETLQPFYYHPVGMGCSDYTQDVEHPIKLKWSKDAIILTRKIQQIQHLHKKPRLTEIGPIWGCLRGMLEDVGIKLCDVFEIKHTQGKY